MPKEILELCDFHALYSMICRHSAHSQQHCFVGYCNKVQCILATGGWLRAYCLGCLLVDILCRPTDD